MINIPIVAAPNQSLSFERDDDRYVIRLFSAAGVVCCDVNINDTRIISGSRVVRGFPLIPYKYLAKNGNFLLVCDEEPQWDQFGITQSLVFFTNDEIES